MNTKHIQDSQISYAMINSHRKYTDNLIMRYIIKWQYKTEDSKNEKD